MRRRPFRQGQQVCAAHPRREVIGQAMGFLVGARHDHDRPARRQLRPTRREMTGARRRGHAKDARFRQMCDR